MEIQVPADLVTEPVNCSFMNAIGTQIAAEVERRFLEQLFDPNNSHCAIPVAKEE